MGPFEWIGLLLGSAGLVLLVRRFKGIKSKQDRELPTLHHTLFASHLSHRVFFRNEGELLRRLR